MVDLHTAPRRAWLASLHGHAAPGERIRTATCIAGLLLVLGVAGRIDHEDALLTKTEREAHASALVRCDGNDLIATAHPTTSGEDQ